MWYVAIPIKMIDRIAYIAQNNLVDVSGSVSIEHILLLIKISEEAIIGNPKAIDAYNWN